jgi:hypothetical protein
MPTRSQLGEESIPSLERTRRVGVPRLRGAIVRVSPRRSTQCWADGMRRSVRRDLLLLLVLISLSLVSTRAEACTCARPMNGEDYYGDSFLKEERQWAVHVFSGTVLKVAPASNAMKTGKVDDRVATFAVSRVWQGPVSRSLQVHWSSDMCDFVFEKGKEYVVFAGGNPPKSSICGFTMSVERAETKRTLARLGAARVPR